MSAATYPPDSRSSPNAHLELPPDLRPEGRASGGSSRCCWPFRSICVVVNHNREFETRSLICRTSCTSFLFLFHPIRGVGNLNFRVCAQPNDEPLPTHGPRLVSYDTKSMCIHPIRVFCYDCCHNQGTRSRSICVLETDI